MGMSGLSFALAVRVGQRFVGAKKGCSRGGAEDAEGWWYGRAANLRVAGWSSLRFVLSLSHPGGGRGPGGGGS
jgi:hypothetical protein